MREDAENAWIEIDRPDGPQRFGLRPDRPCRIGRSETSTIVLIDDLVSRNHAIVQCLDAGSFALVDLGSINGTYIGGRRIAFPTVLRDGEHITIGRNELLFRQQAPEVAPDAVIELPDLNPTNVFHAEKLITVLVADIRDYTGLAQRMNTDTLSQIVAALFRDAGTILQASGVWAQKYIGDAVMAVWIHGQRRTETANEVLSIVRIVSRLVDLAAELQDRFGLEAPIRIGAGLNSGMASVGNVGSIAAADYTAVGDVVNRAFRLESATKEVKCDLLIGEETRRLLADNIGLLSAFREVTVHLKGYEQPVVAWGADFGTLAGVTP